MLWPDRTRRLIPPGLPNDPPERYEWSPALLSVETGYLCAYRCVVAQARTIRTILLDAEFAPVGHPLCVSDIVQSRGSPVRWFADPRLFRWRGRPHMVFNTGHSEIPNQNYVLPLTESGAPAGLPIRLSFDRRRRVEKNWGFFSHGPDLYAIYSISPFVVLRCTLDGDILKAEIAHEHAWLSSHIELPQGRMHGGANPLIVAGTGYAVTQSHTQAPDGKVYRGGVLLFDAEPPFKPKQASPQPLFALTDEERKTVPARRLNPDAVDVFYPTGAALTAQGSLALAYGINDFTGGLRVHAFDALRDRTLPVQLVGAPDDPLRTFFWQPAVDAGRSLDDLTRGLFVTGNVGDSLQENLVGRLYGRPTANSAIGGRRLLGVGSIGHRVLAGDIVWGSGFKEVPPTLIPELRHTVDIRAVRGPLTLDYFRRHGFEVDKVTRFFDPGLLVGTLFRDELALLRERSPGRRRIVVIPHYKLANRHQALPPDAELLQVDQSLFGFLAGLCGAHLVLSSSLHGIVLAEALGIPAVLLRPPADEPFVKYQDYYLGTGRSSFPILDSADRWREATPPPLPQLAVAEWLASAPTIDALHAAGLSQPIEQLGDGARAASPRQPLRTAEGAYVRTSALSMSHFGGEVVDLHLQFVSTAPTRLLITTLSETLFDGAFDTGTRSVRLRVDASAVERTSRGLLQVHLSGKGTAQLLSFGPLG